MGKISPDFGRKGPKFGLFSMVSLLQGLIIKKNLQKAYLWFNIQIKWRDVESSAVDFPTSGEF